MSDLRDCRRSRRSLRVSDTEAWRSGLLGLGVAIQTDTERASGKQVPDGNVGWAQDRDTVGRKGRANRWRGRGKLRELNGSWDGGRLLTIECGRGGGMWWCIQSFWLSSQMSTGTWTVWSSAVDSNGFSPWPDGY